MSGNSSTPGGASASGGSSGSGGAAGSSSVVAVGSPGAAADSASPTLNFGASPPPNFDPTTQSMPGSASRRGVESLARQRGENWGLPDSARKSTPLTRPVQVYCSGDRLTVFSDRGIPDKQINLGPRTEDAVDELVSTVWNQIEGWGIAGRGMYWRPVMSMHVAPDGVERFDELKTLLSGSGLEVTGKPIAVSGATTPTRR
jgi:hypothetical protein